jgi:hypothetical protein
MSGNIVISISTTLSSERQLSDAQFCPKTAGMSANLPFAVRQPSLAKCGMAALSRRQNRIDIPLKRKRGEVTSLIDFFFRLDNLQCWSLGK